MSAKSSHRPLDCTYGVGSVNVDVITTDGVGKVVVIVLVSHDMDDSVTMSVSCTSVEVTLVVLYTRVVLVKYVRKYLICLLTCCPSR